MSVGARFASVGVVSVPAPPSYENAIVWQVAHRFVLAVYRFSLGFPAHETYGLRAQLRRAAVSVPGNFAEGYRRRSVAEKARFYNIAQASLDECRYYLRLAEDLGYGECESLRRNGDELSRLLHAYLSQMLNRTSG